MATKRNINDLYTPTVKRSTLWHIIQRSNVSTPPFNRGDMQEPLYTMIMTAFFAILLLVVGVLFPALGGLVMVLIALIAACFGYEWHTWATMREINRAARDYGLNRAMDRAEKLMRAANRAAAKRQTVKPFEMKRLK